MKAQVFASSRGMESARLKEPHVIRVAEANFSRINIARSLPSRRSAIRRVVRRRQVTRAVALWRLPAQNTAGRQDYGINSS